MSLPRIIGITGRKRHGKDTIGSILHDNYDYHRIAFGDAVKDCCRSVFNFSDEQLYGSQKEDIDDFWKVSPRTVMQFVATELFRNQLAIIMPDIKKDIWIKVVEKEILKNPEIKFVITDVRFQNEIDMIKKYDGSIIRVKRSDVMNNDMVHESEINIDKFVVDYDIINDGTKEELKNQLIKIFC